MATRALSWLGLMCWDDRGPLGALSGRVEGTASSSVHGRQLGANQRWVAWTQVTFPSPLDIKSVSPVSTGPALP